MTWPDRGGGAMSPRKRRRLPRPGDPSYTTVHAAVRAERGKATQHPCAACGDPAAGWSYDNGGDPRELTDPSTGSVYSLDTAHYQAKCRSCRRRADWSHRRRDRAPLDLEECRQLYAAGCSTKGIGRIFGYTSADVRDVLSTAGVQIRAAGQTYRWVRAQQLKQ